MNYDVFNGDADGILALVQWRLAYPEENQLITGIKRDISLLKRIPIENIDKTSTVTVFDISMEKNIEALKCILQRGAKVVYADHHRPGEIPQSSQLDAHIDLSSDTCSALIVDELLNGKFHFWAIAAAYGDNLVDVADKLARKAGLSDSEANLLKEFGTLINYNGYGAHTDDLAYHPADLFRLLVKESNPFDIIGQTGSPYDVLKTAFESDFKQAESAEVIHESSVCLAVQLADEPWSRRISGTFGNHLANQNPERAHLVITEVDNQHVLVSLRAPLNNKAHAGDICSQFETGGGRAGAAGINKLPKEKLTELIRSVEITYQK